jgi:hypothetical protein
MSPFLQSAYNTKEFPVVDFVVSFGRGEGFGYERTRVPFSIAVELSEHGSRSIFGGVALDLKGSSLVWHDQDGFFGESFLEGFERFLGIVIPDEFLVFAVFFAE